MTGNAVVVRTPAQYLAAPTKGRWGTDATLATKAGQGAARAARVGWAVEWNGAPLPWRIEKRLVRTASLYVSRDRREAEWVVACAAGIGKIARVFALAYAKATGDSPLEQDVETAVFAGFELMVQGKRGRLVRDALELAATNDRAVLNVYKEVVRTANGRTPAVGRFHKPTQWEVSMAAIAKAQDVMAGRERGEPDPLPQLPFIQRMAAEQARLDAGPPADISADGRAP